MGGKVSSILSMHCACVSLCLAFVHFVMSFQHV